MIQPTNKTIHIFIKKKLHGFHGHGPLTLWQSLNLHSEGEYSSRFSIVSKDGPKKKCCVEKNKDVVGKDPKK